MAKRKIKKGDNVKVITGSSKGQSGQVLLIDGDYVTVSGVNMVKIHKKPSGSEPGKIVEREAKIHISNVAKA